jgi:hypothetical protein
MLAVACFADYDYVAGSLNDFDADGEDSSCCYFDYLIAVSERADLTLMIEHYCEFLELVLSSDE